MFIWPLPQQRYVRPFLAGKVGTAFRYRCIPFAGFGKTISTLRYGGASQCCLRFWVVFFPQKPCLLRPSALSAAYQRQMNFYAESGFFITSKNVSNDEHEAIIPPNETIMGYSAQQAQQSSKSPFRRMGDFQQ
ncbi:MAG: hypothetical protein IAE95_05360 [Chitinophagaceae bacterium]|nr:hypothetical protein [Chitinophagaceae bacterium]